MAIYITVDGGTTNTRLTLVSDGEILDTVKYSAGAAAGRAAVEAAVAEGIGVLLERNGTVTVAHSRTVDLPSIAKEADILVVAVGRANFVGADMVKEGAVVIDVGINRLDDGRLVGDVNFEEVSKKASYITPVPGGVGPMTITMLMQNTLTAAERNVK